MHMRGMTVALALGLTLTAAAIGTALAQSPARVIAVNTGEHQPVKQTRERVSACQSEEVLPANTYAIRLGIGALLGPRVTVRAWSRGRVIAGGQRGSGWTGGVVTVPVGPLAHAVSGVRLCFDVDLHGEESATLVGQPATGAKAHIGAVPGRVRVEYLRPSGSSWLSLASRVVRHMGFGNVAEGAWSVYLVIVLMASVVCLCSYLALRMPT